MNHVWWRRGQDKSCRKHQRESEREKERDREREKDFMLHIAEHEVRWLECGSVRQHTETIT